MRRKHLDLLIALGIAVANVAWAFAMPANQASPSVIAIILALPLVFVVPGYALTEALFPYRLLETVQRFAFVLALSLTVTILSGFILNQFPTGLHILPWAIWLGLLTTIFSLLAFLRRRKQQPVEVRRQRLGVQIPAIILFGLAALVVVLSVLYSIVGAEQQSHSGFTNLGISQATKAGNTCTVSVDMQSFELASVSYRVVITTNKTTTATWDMVTLVPQQQWIQLEVIPATSTSLVVLVQVYRLDQPQTVYLHVYKTLHVVTKGSAAKQCTSS